MVKKVLFFWFSSNVNASINLDGGRNDQIQVTFGSLMKLTKRWRRWWRTWRKLDIPNRTICKLVAVDTYVVEWRAPVSPLRPLSKASKTLDIHCRDIYQMETTIHHTLRRFENYAALVSSSTLAPFVQQQPLIWLMEGTRSTEVTQQVFFWHHLVEARPSLPLVLENSGLCLLWPWYETNQLA